VQTLHLPSFVLRNVECLKGTSVWIGSVLLAAPASTDLRAVSRYRRIPADKYDRGANSEETSHWLTGFYDGHGSSWKTCAAPNGRPGLGSKPLSSRVGLCPWDRRTRRNTEQRQLRFRERRRFHCLWLVKVIARGARSSSALECTSLRILTVQESMQPEGEWHAEN
jgi:hypothetical protein